MQEDNLLERQFGFRKARSTMDAIEMVMAIAKVFISREDWLEGD